MVAIERKVLFLP